MGLDMTHPGARLASKRGCWSAWVQVFIQSCHACFAQSPVMALAAVA